METKLPNSNPTSGTSSMSTSRSLAFANNDKDVTISLTSTIQLSESSDAVYHYFVASPMYAGFGDLASPERAYFLQEFSSMSPALRNYLTSADTVELIFSIGKEMGLNDSQTSKLGILVRELITGKIFIKDFPSTLSSKLGIEDIKAGEISNKIIGSFGPILEDIKRIQRIKFSDKISQMQQRSQPSSLTQPGARPLPPPPITPAQKIQSSPSTSSQPPQNSGGQAGPAPSAPATQPIKPPSSPIKTEVGPRSEERPLPKPTEVQPPRIPTQPQPMRPPEGPQAMRPPQQTPQSIPPKPEVTPPKTPPEVAVKQPPQPPRPPEAAPRPQPLMRPIHKPVLPALPPELSAAEKARVPGMPQRPSIIDLNKEPGGSINTKLPTSQTPSSKAEKSLESALEKVDNVIDLRSSPKKSG